MNWILEPTVTILAASETDFDESLDLYTDGWHNSNNYCNFDADFIPEFAGRVCYQSFTKRRPGGNKEYLKHILELGHGCFDGETEVLTANGWKSWPDVTEDDSLATIDPDTREVTYHKPIRLVSYYHKGRMYRVDSQNVDLLVTPDHKMLACMTTTVEGRKRENYSLIKAEDLDTKSHAYLKSGDFRKGWWEDRPSRDVLALLGFAIGDGSRQSRSAIRFHLRKERKIAWLYALISRLGEHGYSIQQRDDNYTVSLPDDGFVQEMFNQIYDENKEKQIPQSVLTGVGREELEGLYEGLIQSDGSVGETCITFDTTSNRLAGQFQQLCMHIGLAADVCYTYTKEDRPSSFGDKPLTRLSVQRRTLRPEINKYAGQAGSSQWIDCWEGQVYCAEVPNNTLYVRRNGKTVWSGNSVLEHSVITFLITGVSRSLTHELIRHRAGTAFSELSQRYYEVSDGRLGFILPPDMIGDEALTAAMTLEVRHAVKKYDDFTTMLVAKLSDKWLQENPEKNASREDLTYIRKSARQAARAILPNCTETHMVMTGNIRAWRNIIEQRGSIHADKEIRRLACKIAELSKFLAPNCFQDLELYTDTDGSQSARFTYRKV